LLQFSRRYSEAAVSGGYHFFGATTLGNSVYFVPYAAADVGVLA